MTRKELKARARELNIRCFNLMKREELEEAVDLALSMTRDGQNPAKQTRLEEIQAVAVALGLAQCGDILRLAGSVPSMAVRAYLLVGEIQSFQQRVHGNAPGDHARQKSPSGASISVGTLRKDIRQSQARADRR